MQSDPTPLRTMMMLDILGAIVLVAFVVVGPAIGGDPGVGWHLKTGEWIFNNNLNVPATDLFLNGMEKQEWIANQWLSDVGMWLAYKAGGFGLLSTLTLGACLLPFVLIGTLIRERWVSAPVLFISLFLALAISSLQWIIRPVVISFALFSIVYYFIQRLKVSITGPKWFIAINVVVFLIWANLHSGFVLGLLLLALFAFECLWQRDMNLFRTALLALFGSMVATLINPYLFDLHRNIFELVSSDYFMALNAEWKSPDFHNPLFLPVIGVMLLFVLLSKNSDEIPKFDLLAFGVFLALGLYGARYLPFFAVCVPIPLAMLLQGFLIRNFGDYSNRAVVSAFFERAGDSKWPSGVPTVVLWLALVVYSAVTSTMPGVKAEALVF